MDCLDIEKNKVKFAQKNPTRQDELDSALTELNNILHLPTHKPSTSHNMIHGSHAYGGVTLEGYTGVNDWTVSNIYGVNRMSDPKMTDVVQQIITVIDYAKRHGGKI